MPSNSGRYTIVDAGVVASELPPQRQPMSGTFPQRNRLITGMSLGVIVVEAAEQSGALISARHAMEQGRDPSRLAKHLELQSTLLADAASATVAQQRRAACLSD